MLTVARLAPWWSRGAIVILAALLTVAVIAAAIVITSQQQRNSNGPQITPPTSTQHREPAYGPQVTLPFTGLNNPGDVAVDTAGDLYVADYGNNRVLRLAAGSSSPTVLPFTGLNSPRVWRWMPPATSTSPTPATIGC